MDHGCSGDMLANGKSARTWCCQVCEDQDCDCYKPGKPAQALRYGFEQLLSGSGNNRPKCQAPNYQGALPGSSPGPVRGVGVSFATGRLADTAQISSLAISKRQVNGQF